MSVFPPPWPAPAGVVPAPAPPPATARSRWRLFGFSLLIAALYVVVSEAAAWTVSLSGLVEEWVEHDPNGGVRTVDVASAFRPFLISVDVVCALVAVALAFGARRMWRRSSAGLGWGFLIAVPLTIVVGVPVSGVTFVGLAVARAFHHSGDVRDPGLVRPSGVEIVNDLAVSATVTYCPQQDCTVGWTITLAPGGRHRSGRPSSIDVPDEIRVRATEPRCAQVLPTNETGVATVLLSNADPTSC